MRANEFRLGNYIQTDKGDVAVIIRVEQDGIMVAPIDEEDYDYHILPIPLDEEWLFNFGFKHKYDSVYSIPYGEQEIQIKLQGDRAGVILKSDELALGIYGLDYVHKLQNLYYCLTDKELVITKKRVTNRLPL